MSGTLYTMGNTSTVVGKGYGSSKKVPFAKTSQVEEEKTRMEVVNVDEKNSHNDVV